MRPRKTRLPEFRLDLSRYELQRNGRAIRLENQPMDLLILLVEKQGQLVARDEISARLWDDGIFVNAETSVNTAIRKIRLALDDDPQGSRYVQTVIGKGYRFVGQIEVIPPRPVPQPIFAQSPGGPPHRDNGRLAHLRQTVNISFVRGHTLRLGIFGVAVAFVAALVLFGVNFDWSWRGQGNPPSIRSLAVLPLQNLSGDPSQEYFSEGITDELITDLARVSVLRVIGSNSVMQYKDTRKPLAQVAKELGVDAVVEGAVVQSEGRVRVTAQLIDPRTGHELWAQSFEAPLEDLLSLQDDVAQQITSQIGGALLPNGPLRSHSREIDPAAHNAFLHGRYAMDVRTGKNARRSAQYYREAIALDPGYAPSYAGLARALEVQSYLAVNPPAQLMPQARSAALHAMQLDPTLGEAYTALGAVEVAYDWDWKAARRNLQRGITLNPNEPWPYGIYALYLSATGRPQESVAYARKALQLDPFYFAANCNLAYMLYFAGRYNEALAQLRRAKAMQDHPSLIDAWISDIYQQTGTHEEAIHADLWALQDSRANASEVSAYRAAYARAGWRGYWRARLKHLLPRANRSGVPYRLGVIYVRLGETDNALRWLNESISRHCIWDVWMAVDPKLKPLRSDPRFIRLLAKMGLQTVSPPTNTATTALR